MSPHLLLWERQTYSILDWLGDLGGLYDALFLIVKVILSPISVFSLHSTLLSGFFSFRRSNDEKAEEKEKSPMMQDFSSEKTSL